MIDQANTRATRHAARGVSFARDEAVHAWLPMLLDAYAIADAGVAEGVRRETATGRELACAKGCAACCRTHKDIPVYPLELVGMSWYAVEKIRAPARAKLKERLRRHRRGEACPFLVDGLCSVHPLRPLACRQFNVFGRACAEGEDPFHTRRADVLTPIRRYADAAFDLMLPFYGVSSKTERRRLIKSGAVHRLAQVLQDFDWASLADRMDAHDRRTPSAVGAQE